MNKFKAIQIMGGFEYITGTLAETLKGSLGSALNFNGFKC
jgi:hypothetical protein